MSQPPPRGVPPTRTSNSSSSYRARGTRGTTARVGESAGSTTGSGDGGVGGNTGDSSYGGRRERGGRNRGKSARARGSKRGMRIPPEYLAQVIAQREGRDPSDLTNSNLTEDDLNEEEIEEFYKQFSARPLESNEAKYEEPAADEGEEEERKEEEENTRRILMAHQQRTQETEDAGALIGKSQSKGNDKVSMEVSDTYQPEEDSKITDDVDHALGASLRSISIRTGKRTNANDDNDVTKGAKMVQIEWDEELEEMSREKASAEARSAMKERFRSQNSRGRGYHPQRAAKALPSKALGTNPDMNQLEAFLDDLLK